jgi:hypothetical protein
MRKDGVLRTIDASPVGAALVSFLSATPGGFNGTLSELLGRLDHHRPQGEVWPRSPKGLGDALRRLAPALRLIGFECKNLPKTGGAIRWHIFSRPSLVEPCPASPECPDRPTPRPAGSSGEAGHAGHAGHAPSVRPPKKGMPCSHDDSGADDGEVF